MVVIIIFDFSLSLMSLTNHLSNHLKKAISLTSVKCVHSFVPVHSSPLRQQCHFLCCCNSLLSILTRSSLSSFMYLQSCQQFLLRVELATCPSVEDKPWWVTV